MTSRLTNLLGPRAVAVCDGAMGTMLYAKGVFINRSFDELNLSQPELVRSVHQAYVEAGADMIETNTFASNSFKLAAHGLEELVSQINEEAVKLAREAAGQEVLVAGAMGPLGVRIEPWGSLSVEEARAAFRQQAEALLRGGVDLLILETFHHLPELREAVAAIRELSSEIPLVVQMAITEDITTPEGVEARAFTKAASEWDVDCIGVNCGVGPIATLEALEEMRGATNLPLSAMPNAGQPRSVHGRNIYLSSPEYLSSYARRFIQAGARLVGGCCGTDPSHIRAIKEAVVALHPGPEWRRPALTQSDVGERVPPAEPVAEKSALGRRLAEGAFAVLAQVLPPRGGRFEPALEWVGTLKAGGLKLVSIPELRSASTIPPFALGQLCEQRQQVEALLEFACRHRTLLRMQSELLGAHALGIRNLMLVTGPPLTTTGQHPDTLADLEVDSIGLTNMVRRLNQGLDVAGNELGWATSFLIGVKLDPSAVDPHYEVRRFEWKVDAGAEFALTPPVIDVPAFEEFLKRIEHCRIPIVASISPLTSYRAAERLARQTGPAGVPSHVLEQLQEAEKKGQEAEVGLEIAIATARALRPLVQGIQVNAASDRPQAVTELLRAVQAL